MPSARRCLEAIRLGAHYYWPWPRRPARLLRYDPWCGQLVPRRRRRPCIQSRRGLKRELRLPFQLPLVIYTSSSSSSSSESYVCAVAAVVRFRVSYRQQISPPPSHGSQNRYLSQLPEHHHRTVCAMARVAALRRWPSTSDSQACLMFATPTWYELAQAVCH